MHHKLLPSHRFNGIVRWNESKSTFMEQPAAPRLVNQPPLFFAHPSARTQGANSESKAMSSIV